MHFDSSTTGWYASYKSGIARLSLEAKAVEYLESWA